jgi:hypothetical protein
MMPLPAPPWASCFEDPDHPGRPATVQLQQVTRKSFLLRSSLRYTGDTGVPELPEAARTLRPADLGDPPLTDLTTVPSVLRWFVGTYGIRTPAALLHDRLVGPHNTVAVDNVDADRFFRHMLKALGIRLLRRWMMWTAVAFGTRWRSMPLRLLLVLWVLLSAIGMCSFGYAVATGSWELLVVAAVAPVPASVLWGRQFGAGLIAAATALWVLPPTVFGAVGFGTYWVLEQLVSALPLDRSVKGDEPVAYKHF